MGEFDVKATLDAIVAYINQNYLLVAIAVGLLILFSSRGVFARIRIAIEKALTENWQLTLLASTGIALSLASGYTTFDGLRNFTNAPLLSVAISFGIQGVMLIVAWLIGESFATGLNQRTSDGKRLRLADAGVGMALGVAFVALVFYWFLNQYDAVTVTQQAGMHADWVKFSNVSVYFLLALVLMGLIAFGFNRGGDISTPYVQSFRLIIKNAVLWVMFLASMSASVFFSFDSHFNAIFPTDARKRAAEIRTTNQIGGVVADIGALTQKRQIEEAERLFDTEGWKAYDKQLASLAQAAQGAQAEIEKYFVQLMEERRRAVAQQQERIATAQSGQAGLAGKKISLTEELSRLKGERPGLAAEYGQHKSELDAKAKEIDGKRVEGLAEDRGVEGTLKQGRGPVFRQRMAELATLNDQYKIKGERTKDAQKRLAVVETRIAQIERELSTIDGDLAKLKGEAETAEQRIKNAQATNADDEGAKLDPARVLPAFERARAAFRQQPDTERLAALQTQCGNLLTAMSSTQATKERVRAIDCDPKQAAEAAARVFALNAGVVAYQANCAGGDKLAKLTTTDGLLGFGRKCLQDSGLISKDSADVGGRLSSIDMNRDDKAHRFVVTWNAFLDGNRLAYLSLVLAIGVDALVFMSGLFGAQALRSPLSDVPSPKARSAEQLEAIIKNSLGADRLENAELVLAAMHPLSGVPGYHAEIDLTQYGDEAARRIRKVLVAGSSIGAVKRADSGVGGERYFVRSELFEFLSVVSHAAKESDSEYVDRTRLIRIIGVALEPDRAGNAKILLQYMEPINPRHGFMATVDLDRVPAPDNLLMRNLLNAGMTINAAQRFDRKILRKSGLGRLLRAGAGVETAYFVRTDLFKTLLLYSAGDSSIEASTRGALHLRNSSEAAPAQIARHSGNMDDQYADLGNGHVASSGNYAVNPATRVDMERVIMQALGMPVASLGKLSAPEVAGEAIAAANTLKRQAERGRHAGLVSELKLVESDNLRVLEQAERALAAHYEGDLDSLQLLNEVSREIRQRLSALMLLPEGGLMDRLTGDLEAAFAENRLSDDEHFLLSKLRKLKRELENLDTNDARAWRRIAHDMERLNDVGMMAAAPLGDGAGPTKH